jgi:hypothetical protein
VNDARLAAEGIPNPSVRRSTRRDANGTLSRGRNQVRPEMMRRRATWRWCLAGGAACILLGIGLGSPSGGASAGNTSETIAARSHTRDEPRRPRPRRRPTTTHATAATHAPTDLGLPVTPGSFDGSSHGSLEPSSTTLPAVHAHTVGDTAPAVESVPSNTAPALLLLVIGPGVFAAGWTIGRRRALPQA